MHVLAYTSRIMYTNFRNKQTITLKWFEVKELKALLNTARRLKLGLRYLKAMTCLELFRRIPLRNFTAKLQQQKPRL